MPKKEMGDRDRNREIPSTIASQFPDNIRKPFWAFRDKKSLADEFFDCYVSFKELHCQEYFWDWQARSLDEVLMKKLVKSYDHFFDKHPIGDKRFLTFLVNDNNINDLGKLYMSIILSNEYAKENKLHSPPLFEVVHTSNSSDTLLHFMDLYTESVTIACDRFNRDIGPKSISIIPTHDFNTESSTWFRNLHDYITTYQQNFRTRLQEFRPLIPRQKIADKVGFIAAVLTTKRALSNYHAFSEMMDIPVQPIVQASVLPFRGNLSPDTIKEFAATYPGMRSVTISQSFRYDFKVDKVIPAIKSLNNGLPKHKRQILSKEQGHLLKKIEAVFEKSYQKAIENIPPFTKIHDRLEVHKDIKTTFALYSLGIPPEFIGIGNAILKLIKDGDIKALEMFYPTIKDDLRQAGRLLNRENLEMLGKTAPFWNSLRKEVSLIEDYVGELGPKDTDDFVHRNHTSNVFHRMNSGQDFKQDLKEAAKARHSLG